MPSIDTLINTVYRYPYYVPVSPHTHHITHVHFYTFGICTGQYNITVLQTLLVHLLPFLDRLLRNNAGIVEGCIEGNILPDGRLGSWLLQIASGGHLGTDEDDQLGLHVWGLE